VGREEKRVEFSFDSFVGNGNFGRTFRNSRIFIFKILVLKKKKKVKKENGKREKKLVSSNYLYHQIKFPMFI